MTVTVVVGGQYGSEGKGKICALLARKGLADIMIRCGGPNSGHTIDWHGVQTPLRQVPAGVVNSNTRLLIAAGALINPLILLEEIKTWGLTPAQLGIDARAGIINEDDLDIEKRDSFEGRFGSTLSGTGLAVSRRVLREDSFKEARDIPELSSFITSVQDESNLASLIGKNIVIEGTQGYGLSLFHADEWPYRTSKDTTAHAFLSEVGLGVRNYKVIVVVRTFPIRVSGNSGPMYEERDWDYIQQISNYQHGLAEYTTNTKRLRRVGLFDWDLLNKAVIANSPTQIALTGADYINYRNLGAQKFNELTTSTKSFVDKVGQYSRTYVSYVGTGERQYDGIDMGLGE